MKPLIGITTGEIVDETWGPIFYGQKHTYSDAVVAAGGVPILIPVLPESELKEVYSRLDGIVFAGGSDIDPRLYGEEIHSQTKTISTKRDSHESILMAWALADDKPLLAICRGHQLLNVLLGGSLYQDIYSQLPKASDHRISVHEKDTTYIAHTLAIEPTSQLASITHSLQIDANSQHHQAVKNVARELRATAWSEDGVIEALEHPAKTFTLGVQCHPESLFSTDEKWLSVFRAFVQATANTPSPINVSHHVAS